VREKPSAIRAQTKEADNGLRIGLQAASTAFLSPNGPRATLAEYGVHENILLIGTYPLVPAGQVANLTDAEREVLAALLMGSTNRDIAQRRHCSEHTVANQVQAIFRKVGARSRSELPIRLQQDPSGHTEA
jgi:DNA-binding NarL/FixJ family response regulator